MLVNEFLVSGKVGRRRTDSARQTKPGEITYRHRRRGEGVAHEYCRTAACREMLAGINAHGPLHYRGARIALNDPSQVTQHVVNGEAARDSGICLAAGT